MLWASQKKSPPVWSQHSEGTPVTANLPNLISFVWGDLIDFCNRLRYIHSELREKGGGNATVAQSNILWPSAPAQQRNHFPNPVGVVRFEKERKEEGGQESLSLTQKTVWLLDPAGLKERQRAALSPSDKWTGSIDCKVFRWRGCELGQSTIAVFLFDT